MLRRSADGRRETGEPRAATGRRQSALAQLALRLQRGPGNAAVARRLQRVKTRELVHDPEIDMDTLAGIARWLDARAGADFGDRELLLHGMTKEQVLASAAKYVERVTAESRAGDLIEQFAAREPPTRLMEAAFAASRAIAPFVGGRAIDRIEVLDDAEFTAAHFEAKLANNAELLRDATPEQLRDLRLVANRRIDGVTAFEFRGTIYMRPGEVGLHVAIHEAVHRYGGIGFQAIFGHPMNEGATEWIARLVCADSAIPVDESQYAPERLMLTQIRDVLRITDAELLDAYFRDDVAPLHERLIDRIGAARAKEFARAKTVSAAVAAFKAGQREVASGTGNPVAHAKT